VQAHVQSIEACFFKCFFRGLGFLEYFQINTLTEKFIFFLFGIGILKLVRQESCVKVRVYWTPS
jgi:hypothetical protein